MGTSGPTCAAALWEELHVRVFHSRAFDSGSRRIAVTRYWPGADSKHAECQTDQRVGLGNSSSLAVRSQQDTWHSSGVGLHRGQSCTHDKTPKEATDVFEGGADTGRNQAAGVETAGAVAFAGSIVNAHGVADRRTAGITLAQRRPRDRCHPRGRDCLRGSLR